MSATHKNASDGSIPTAGFRIRLYRLKSCRTFCGAPGPTEEWLHFRGSKSLESSDERRSSCSTRKHIECLQQDFLYKGSSTDLFHLPIHHSIISINNNYKQLTSITTNTTNSTTNHQTFPTHFQNAVLHRHHCSRCRHGRLSRRCLRRL